MTWSTLSWFTWGEAKVVAAQATTATRSLPRPRRPAHRASPLSVSAPLPQHLLFSRVPSAASPWSVNALFHSADELSEFGEESWHHSRAAAPLPKVLRGVSTERALPKPTHPTPLRNHRCWTPTAKRSDCCCLYGWSCWFSGNSGTLVCSDWCCGLFGRWLGLCCGRRCLGDGEPQLLRRHLSAPKAPVTSADGLRCWWSRGDPTDRPRPQCKCVFTVPFLRGILSEFVQHFTVVSPYIFVF